MVLQHHSVSIPFKFDGLSETKVHIFLKTIVNL
jgi:hypothetical protein